MTQRERIYDYMKEFGSISTMEAFRDLGVTRLAARIGEMESSGIQIERQFETAKNRYGDKVSFARYSLAVPQ